MDIKILIVDDEENITSSLKRYFKLMDYKVDSCNSPVEALEMIYKHNYKVVISDISMPEMTGIELLQKIKEYNGMIQVIMITGVVTVENVLGGLKGGANECLLKPLDDLEELKSAVDQSIAKLEKWEGMLKTMVRRK